MSFKRSVAFLPFLGAVVLAQAPNLSLSPAISAASAPLTPQLNLQTWSAVKSANDSRSVRDGADDHGHDVVCSGRADSSITQIGSRATSGRYSFDGRFRGRMQMFDLGSWTEVTLTGSVDSSFLLPTPGGYGEASFLVEHSTYISRLRSAKSNATGARTSTSPLRLETHESFSLGSIMTISRLISVSSTQRLAVRVNVNGTARLDVAASLVPVGPNGPSAQLTGPTRIDTFGHFLGSYELGCNRITIEEELMPLDCSVTANLSSTSSGPGGSLRLQDRQTRILLRLIKSFCGAQSVQNAINLLFPAVDRVQVLQ